MFRRNLDQKSKCKGLHNNRNYSNLGEVTLIPRCEETPYNQFWFKKLPSKLQHVFLLLQRLNKILAESIPYYKLG